MLRKSVHFGRSDVAQHAVCPDISVSGPSRQGSFVRTGHRPAESANQTDSQLVEMVAEDQCDLGTRERGLEHRF